MTSVCYSHYYTSTNKLKFKPLSYSYVYYSRPAISVPLVMNVTILDIRARCLQEALENISLFSSQNEVMPIIVLISLQMYKTFCLHHRLGS